VLFEVEQDLARLREAQELLAARPGLSGALPGLPVVGFPNVGKFSLVARLTRARLRVAPYPFTTLTTAAGHLALRPGVKTPLVDTPGLREAEGRSSHAAEREALLALQHAGPVALFLFDPSGRCGWPMEEQERLLTRLTERFPGRRFVEVENKADLVRAATGRRKISCETGEGLPELVEELRSIFREMGTDQLPPLPPLRETLDEAPGKGPPLVPRPRHGSA
jgi:nucleolar GTP-binding protein